MVDDQHAALGRDPGDRGAHLFVERLQLGEVGFLALAVGGRVVRVGGDEPVRDVAHVDHRVRDAQPHVRVDAFGGRDAAARYVLLVFLVFLVVTALERVDALGRDHEGGVAGEVLEDRAEGAFLEVVAVDDHDVRRGDVADVGGGRAEAVRVRARRDHGDDVGVLSGDLLGEVGEDARGSDHPEAPVAVIAAVVPSRARRRDSEREHESERGREPP